MMKYVAMVVVAVFGLAGASPVLAGKPKPPKNLCFSGITFTGDHHELIVKSAGAIKTQPGKIKFFSITGSSFNASQFPVIGAGHMQGNVFHASYQGSVNGIGPCAFELLFNVDTGTGTIHYHYDTDSDTVIEGTDTVAAGDCKTFTIPGATLQIGAPTSAGQ